MELVRVFNNNVVLARDEAGREVILTGRGLGFQARPGQRVDPEKVIRVFVADAGRRADALAPLLAAIPPEVVDLVVAALDEEDDDLGGVPSSTVVALADHLAFAIRRAAGGVVVGYPLRAEVAHLYPRELALPERILGRVNKHLAVALAADEAVPLALHLVNAAFTSGNLADTYQMTGVLSQVFDVIEGATGVPIDRASSSAARFITHLRYFFVRAHDDCQFEEDPEPLAASIARSHPEAVTCARRVREILELRLGAGVSGGETTYLAMHIARLIST